MSRDVQTPFLGTPLAALEIEHDTVQQGQNMQLSTRIGCSLLPLPGAAGPDTASLFSCRVQLGTDRQLRKRPRRSQKSACAMYVHHAIQYYRMISHDVIVCYVIMLCCTDIV